MDFLTTGLIIFTFLILLVLTSNYLFVISYQDPNDSYILSNVVTVLTLSTTLICVLLIPIDILLTSGSIQGISELSSTDTKQALVYILSFMLLLAFVFIPFTYFYIEEVFDEFDSDEKTFCNKFCKASQYTLFTLLICVLLSVVGLSIRPSNKEWGQGKEWIRQLFDLESGGEAAISFTVACLTVIGGGIWSLYTSYGMGVLPSLLIWGRKSSKDHIRELDLGLSEIEEKIKEIELKSSKNKKKDSLEKVKLVKEQKKMLKKSEKLKNNRENWGLQVLFKILKPFKITIGVVFGVIGVVFMVSLLIGSVNRLMHSECGYKCGFMTEKNLLINPLDYFLVQASKWFPLDYFLFITIFLYKYIASLYALVSMGVRLLCILVSSIQIFPIKAKKTLPQGLLLASIIIMLIFLGIAMEILTVLPIYSTFGFQQIEENGEVKTCSFENYGKSCNMSNISQLFNK